jgi:hypothetical protein
MTRTEINNAFGRNVKSAAIGQALARLQRDRFARMTVQRTTGRPVETWYAMDPHACTLYEKNELNEITTPSPETDGEDTPLNSFHSFNSCKQRAHIRTGEADGQLVYLDCGEVLEVAAPPPAFTAFTASELWCTPCGKAQPVTQRGNAYYCNVCGVVVATTTATGGNGVPAVGDWVLPLSVDGVIIPDNDIPPPYLIYNIEQGPDGLPYAMFLENGKFWPLARCEKVDPPAPAHGSPAAGADECDEGVLS